MLNIGGKRNGMLCYLGSLMNGYKASQCHGIQKACAFHSREGRLRKLQKTS